MVVQLRPFLGEDCALLSFNGVQPTTDMCMRVARCCPNLYRLGEPESWRLD
eukprot:SAG11_NODE_3132_length_2664_cov_1.502924_4_plen_51_part_00